MTLQETIDRIRTFERSAGWDSYDALEVTKATVERAIAWLRVLIELGAVTSTSLAGGSIVPIPNVYPTNLGGIEFEWEAEHDEDDYYVDSVTVHIAPEGVTCVFTRDDKDTTMNVDVQTVDDIIERIWNL